MTFDEKVIDAFQLTSAALVKYEKQAAEQESQKQAVASVVPGVVEALLHFGRIEPEDKEACARALTDPVQTLELMKKLAAHRSAAEETTLGEQVDANGRPAGQQKKASARLAGGGYVGRLTSEVPDSWKRFESNILGS